MRYMFGYVIFILLLLPFSSGQWVRPTASGSAAGGVFTWFGAFNVSDNVTSPVYCIGTYCIDTWPNMSIPGSYLNSSNLTFIRETINNSGEYNIFINYSNLLNAPSYTNMTDTRWNVTASRYLYNSSANGNLMFNDTVADNYTWSTDGLVFYAPFNGDALDYSGYGQDGTGRNISSIEGKYGKAYAFLGITSNITLPYDTKQDLQNLTLSAWVKYNLKGANTHHMIIAKKYDYWLDITRNTDGNKAALYIEGGYCYIQSPSAIPTNTWNLITGTYDATSGICKLYVNGILVNNYTNATTISYSTTGAYIGSQESFDGIFNGTIDEVRIWNRSLSADEVMGLYKMKSEVYPPNSVRNVANLTTTSLTIKPSFIGNNFTVIDIFPQGTTRNPRIYYENSTSRKMLDIYPERTDPAYIQLESTTTGDIILWLEGTGSQYIKTWDPLSGKNMYIGIYGSNTTNQNTFTYLTWGGDNKLSVSNNGIKIGNTTTGAPTNGFLEVTANLSNRSIHAVGAIWSDTEVSAPIITDRSGFDEDITMEDILKVKSNGQGEIDYPSLATSLGKTSEQVKTYSMVTEMQDKEQCIDKPILDEKGIETGKQPECTTTKQPVQVQQQTGTEQVPARDLGKFASGPYVGIQQLYAELCQQGIKLKHCDLVVK